jgi:hypothetical protein
MGLRLLVIALLGVNVLLAAMLVGQAGSASAAGEPGTVRAKAFELIDEDGRPRAQLNVEANGEAVFRLRDSNGEIRVKLGAGGDGSGLLLLDGATEPAIHMLARKSGTSVTLISRDGQRRVIAP